jgi:hypothetical protein
LIPRLSFASKHIITALLTDLTRRRGGKRLDLKHGTFQVSKRLSTGRHKYLKG